MPLRRVTEDEILEYLDGNFSGRQRKEFEERLNAFPDDRKLLEEYRALFGHLANRESYSEAVLEAVPSPQRGHYVPTWLSVVTMSAAAAIGLAGILIAASMLGTQPLLALWAYVVAATSQVVSQIIDPVAGLLFGLNVSLAVVVAAGIVLLGIKSLDMILVEAKYRRIMR